MFTKKKSKNYDLPKIVFPTEYSVISTELSKPLFNKLLYSMLQLVLHLTFSPLDSVITAVERELLLCKNTGSFKPTSKTARNSHQNKLTTSECFCGQKYTDVSGW